MNIDKRKRSELKQYFVKNAIPTESNFAELIDAMLSQKDDGIAKLPNDPLSIEAAGDATSQKKALHLYASFADTDPAWVLSLNPRQNPADPATAKAGLSVSDAAGNSRLFIEKGTGKIGVGTVTPASDLTIRRDVSAALGPVITLLNAAGTAGAGGAIDFNGYNVLGNAPTARIRSLDNGNYSSHLAFSTKDSGAADKPLVERMRLTDAGNVGIGTATPRGRVDVPAGDVYFGRAVVITAPADAWNGGVLNLHNETSKKYWHINIRANEADKLIFWRHDTVSFLAVLRLGMDGVVEAPGGVMANSIGLGTQTQGKTTWPYETIQMASNHNLRVWFGTTERFILQNDGNLVAPTVRLSNSDMYFTSPDHNHTGAGNAAGWAAIENAKDYDALMILGRAGTSVGRKVRLWDYLKVEGTLANLSDARTKQDVTDLEYGLNEIKKLRPIAFNWIHKANPHKSLGLVGQEVKDVIHEVVYEDDGELSISYLNLVPVLINAIRDLDRKIESLAAQGATP